MLSLIIFFASLVEVWVKVPVVLSKEATNVGSPVIFYWYYQTLNEEVVASEPVSPDVSAIKKSILPPLQNPIPDL